MQVPILMLGEDYVSGRAPTMLGYDFVAEDTGAVDSKGKRIYSDGTGSMTYPSIFVVNEYGQKAMPSGTMAKPAPGSEVPKTSSGKSYQQVIDSILPILKTGLENTPAIINAIRNKNPGMSEAEAAKIANYAKQENMLAQSMPWLVIGGVGLVAVLLLIGTRKR